MISLFKMTYEQNAVVLSGVPKCKQAVMCLREKIQMFDKLLSGMSNGTVGSELSISESTIYVNMVSLNRNAHKIRLCIYQLLRIVTRGNRYPRSWLCIPPGAVVQYSWIQCSRPLYRQHPLQVTGISCSYFILFCWTDRDHQSSILHIRVFRVYVNAGLCTLISGAP